MRPIRRLSVYILVGIPLVPVAAFVGFLATCLSFPLAMIGILSLDLWKVALGMAAAGTIIVLPLALALRD